MGLKFHNSEVYILKLRHMQEKYHIGPWEWDMDYPEEMSGKYFPEDLNALVGLDAAIAIHHKQEREKKK